MYLSITAVNRAVFETASASGSPPYHRPEAPPRSAAHSDLTGSSSRNPGSTAAPVFLAMRASPDPVHAGYAEERHEGTLRRCHIRIHQNTDGATSPHLQNETSCKIIFVKHTIAMHAPNRIDITVHQRIIESSDHHAHWKAHQRMEEAGELPRTQEVSGKNQYSLPLIACSLKMLQTSVRNDRFDRPPFVPRHQGKLRELMSKLSVLSSQQAVAIFFAHCGKCQL